MRFPICDKTKYRLPLIGRRRWWREGDVHGLTAFLSSPLRAKAQQGA